MEKEAQTQTGGHTVDPLPDMVMVGGKLWDVRRLTRVGNSWAIIMPAGWVKWLCEEMDGRPYVLLSVEKEDLRIRPMDRETLAGLQSEMMDDADGS